MTAPFQGGCACGQIRYESTAAPIAMLNCHCRACQRASGGACSNVVVVPAAGFRILQGTPKDCVRKGDNGHDVRRFWCGDCGSPLFGLASRRSQFTIIRAGSLDDPSGFKAGVDIWTSTAQPWAHITSGVSIPTDAP